ncbi:MAG: hypothetical protein ACREXW_01170 [Gammaproteobacteria bacterium]
MKRTKEDYVWALKLAARLLMSRVDERFVEDLQRGGNHQSNQALLLGEAMEEAFREAVGRSVPSGQTEEPPTALPPQD